MLSSLNFILQQGYPSRWQREASWCNLSVFQHSFWYCFSQYPSRQNIQHTARQVHSMMGEQLAEALASLVMVRLSSVLVSPCVAPLLLSGDEMPQLLPLSQWGSSWGGRWCFSYPPEQVAYSTSSSAKCRSWLPTPRTVNSRVLLVLSLGTTEKGLATSRPSLYRYIYTLIHPRQPRFWRSLRVSS